MMLMGRPRSLLYLNVGIRAAAYHIFAREKIDPYVVAHYKGQERKTRIERGAGSNPEWNQKLTMKAEYPGSGSDYTITLKVFDHDNFSSDDYIGQAKISVEDLLALGVENGSYELHPTKFRLVDNNEKYAGDIKVSVKFTKTENGYDDAEEIGGWKGSYGDDDE